MKKTITRMLVVAVVVGTTGTVLAEKDFGDFCKPVCRMETPVWESLLELDNGRARFPVAVRKDGVVWLPEYALMPYLFVKDDPKLPLAALTLDDFGSRVVLDVVENLLK